MEQDKTSQLYDLQAAASYYEGRYDEGYMEFWPEEIKRKITDVINSLGLPESGEALDFGCGNGLLTEVLRLALPGGWKVYGVDLSAKAVSNAAARFSSCAFFSPGDEKFATKKFDLLFSHHVLEHVYDLAEVVGDIDNCMKDSAAMLHILPCGNDGSFEKEICLLRKDGINPAQGNRFFFEVEGHVRRLTTDQLCAAFEKTGFELSRGFYANQYHGAIDWIARYDRAFIKNFCDSSKAVNKDAKKKLKLLELKLLALWAMMYPASIVDGKLRKKNRSPRDYAILIPGLLLYPFSKFMDLRLKRKAKKEWETKNTEINGSEMFLYFKR